MEESSLKKITKSVLVNIMLIDFLEREKYLTELDFVPIARNNLKSLFRNMGEKRIHRMAEQASNYLVNDATDYIYGKINLNNLLRFLEWFLKTQGNLRIHEKSEDNKFTLKHNICIEYSIFLAKVLENISFDDQKIIVQIMKTSANLITFKVFLH